MQSLQVIRRHLIILLVLILIPTIGRAKVLINEVAWMGTENSVNDEWLELLNSGSESVDLTGWTLTAADGTPSINLLLIILAGGFLLLERTDDTSVPNVPADIIYKGALSNSGEILILKDANSYEVDKVEASARWPAGDNTTKETMQRSTAGGWLTAPATPRAANAIGGPSDTPATTPPPTTSPSASSPAPPSSSAVSSSSINLKAGAGPDRVAEVGELLAFDGTGSSEAISYQWYFGDGFGAQGSVVSHRYNSTGRYTVTLEVSDGSQISTDELIVEVRAPRVIINEFFVSEAAGLSWIELFNSSAASANLDGWRLEMGPGRFEFSAASRLAPQSYLLLEERLTSLRPQPNTPIRIRAPGGSIVDEIAVGELKTGWAAARQGQKFYWTSQPTPGAMNVIVSPTITTTTIPAPSKTLSQNSAAAPPTNNIVTAAVTERPSSDAPPGAEEPAEKKDKKQIDFIAWLSIVVGFLIAVGLGTTWYLHKRKKIFIS